jgi:NTE family protein
MHSFLSPAARLSLLAIFSILLLSGCATSLINQPKNQPLMGAGSNLDNMVRTRANVAGESVVALSFSGGGLRAAAFSYGVLQGLGQVKTKQNESLLNDVTFITSVSGGSITAAYFGLNGVNGLTRFREEALLRDGEAELRLSLFNPVNLTRLFAGGLNDRSNFQAWLEGDLFKGATFADMFRTGKPVVWINATNVFHRVAFPFHERAFDAICSDLSTFPVSEAVAASMAVPVVFAPVVLEKYPKNCKSDLSAILAPQRKVESTENTRLRRALTRALTDFRSLDSGRYLKLIDGGITDNLGLVSILQSRILLGTPYGPLSENDAVAMRKMLFVVVDAGQGPSGVWTREISGPSGVEIASAAVDAAIDSTMRMSYDGFVPMMRNWRDDIVRYRCALPADRRAALIEQRANWKCDDLIFTVTQVSFTDFGDKEEAQLSAIPTRLKLPTAQIDQLIDAGKRVVQGNETVAAFAKY